MALKKPSFRFKTNKPGLKKVLGDLEEAIMEVIWENYQCESSPVSVKDVHDALRKKRRIAYTTVMTTMKILADKGILRRNKIKRAYLYTPVYTKEQFTKIVVAQVVGGLMDGFAQPFLAHFVGIVKNKDVKVAASLEKLLSQRINSAANKRGKL